MAKSKWYLVRDEEDFKRYCSKLKDMLDYDERDKPSSYPALVTGYRTTETMMFNDTITVTELFFVYPKTAKNLIDAAEKATKAKREKK